MPNGKFGSGAIVLLTLILTVQPLLSVSHRPVLLGHTLSPSLTDEEELPTNSKYASPWAGPQQVKGTLSLIVIAVEFPDKFFTTTIEQVNTIFFQNLRRYIEEVSYGQVTVQGKVQGIYRVSRSMFSYGWDQGAIDGSLSGVRTHELVQDAIDKADPDTNFEGYEYLMVLHAGEGQESTPANPENIWSVTYLHGIWFTTKDNKSYATAAIVPEKEGRGADVLGVIAHEFGHLLGLPDLYNPVKNASEGDAGKWDLMARGLWNGNPPGSRPAHPTSWCKTKLGWIGADQIKQIEIGRSSTEYLGSVESPQGDVKAVRIPLSDNSCHFVEYRSRFYDPYLPNEGILIMRIDEHASGERGSITLVCARPGLDNATFRLGDHYLNTKEKVLISTRFADNKTCGIDVFRCQYAAIKMSMPFRGATFFVDGKPCTALSSGTLTVFVTPASHTVSVPSWVVQERARLVFVCWGDGFAKNERMVQTTSNVSLSVVCKWQTLLTVRSAGVPDFRHSGTIQIDGTPYTIHDSTGIDLWIDLNKSVRVFVVNFKIEAERDVRYIFKGWMGLNLNSTEVNVRMSQPMELVARFGKQYYLKVRSQFGNPIGEGWYDDGATARFQVSSPQYLSNKERAVFECWTGDCSIDKQTSSMILDKPRQVTAQWKRQYLTSMKILDYYGRPLDTNRVKALIEAPNGTRLDGPIKRDLWLDNGVWKIRGVWLMGVDVLPPGQTFMPSADGMWTVRARAYVLTVRVSTRLLMIAVPAASIHLQLSQGGGSVLSTNADGVAAFCGLPYGKYEFQVMKEGKIVSRGIVELVDDFYLWVRIDDLLENIVMTVFLALSSLSMVVLVMRVRRSRVRSKRCRHEKPSPNIEEKVYGYVIGHHGIMSRSIAAQELGISQEALNLAIRRMLDSGRLKSC